jgi:hypothetical protein
MRNRNRVANTRYSSCSDILVLLEKGVNAVRDAAIDDDDDVTKKT